MKQQTDSPKYATLLYGVLHELEITIPEYFYLDMVYHLSRNGWCYKSLSSVAKDMRMHRNGVQKMKNRLIEMGLLKKSIKGYVKTTDMYHSVLRQPQQSSHSVTNRNTQYYATIPLSGTKNNNKNNIDNRGKKSKNKEHIRQALLSKDWGKLKT